jgi:3-oxoacyl-(acyl-carrier-protein) synthase
VTAPEPTAPVEVLGWDAVTALGDLEATRKGLHGGASALAPAGAAGFPALRVARIAAEEGAEADDPMERILGFHGRLLETCARSAHARSGVGALDPADVGLFVAVGVADTAVEDLAPAVLASRGDSGAFELRRFFESGFRSIHPLWPLTMLANVGVGQVATDLVVRGDNLVVGTEADAGVRAFEEALASLEEGAALAAIVGGASDRVLPASLARHSLRGGWSRAPLGEGAAALVLATPGVAERLGRRPVGRVLAAAAAWDPTDVGPPSPALARAAEEALARAGAARDRVAIVLGDPLAGDLASFPGRRIDTRAAFGHLSAGAAAVDAALALETLAEDGRPGALALVLAASSTGGAGALVLEAS